MELSASIKLQNITSPPSNTPTKRLLSSLRPQRPQPVSVSLDLLAQTFL